LATKQAIVILSRDVNVPPAEKQISKGIPIDSILALLALLFHHLDKLFLYLIASIMFGRAKHYFANTLHSTQRRNVGKIIIAAKS